MSFTVVIYAVSIYVLLFFIDSYLCFSVSVHVCFLSVVLFVIHYVVSFVCSSVYRYSYFVLGLMFVIHFIGCYCMFLLFIMCFYVYCIF